MSSMVENSPLSPSTDPDRDRTNQSNNNGGGSNLISELNSNFSSSALENIGSPASFGTDQPPGKMEEYENDHGFDSGNLPRDKDRPYLTDSELNDASREQLVDMYQQLQRYIDDLQQKNYEEVSILRESEEKLRGQQLEASRRENVLVMRLTMKEHEMQEYAAQLNELKSMMVPSTGALRSTLLDPAVNILIQKMKKELEDTKKKLEDTQNDLNAWKFTPDSNTGKRLMAKCRMLYQENEELGKMITSGKVAKLETDLALQKSLTEEMRKAQAEMDDVVQELDEDIDGMQSTICFWQEQLRRHQQQQNMDVDESLEQGTRIHRRVRSSSPQSNPPSNDPTADIRPSEPDAESVSVSSTPTRGTPVEAVVGNSSSSDSFAPAECGRTGEEVQRNGEENQCNNSALSANTSSSMDAISEGDEEA